jgi:hypothetical protein
MMAETRPDGARRWRVGAWLQSAAVVVLLGVCAGRCFVAEMPHRTGVLEFNTSPVQGSGGAVSRPKTDRSEWARASFAAVLLAAGLLGAVGIALDRRTPLPPHWMILAVGVFGVMGALSTAGASDQRTAQLVYVEQLSLLILGLLTTSLLIPPRRRRWAVIAMVSAGIALAAKGYLQLAFDIPDRIAEFQQNRQRYLWMFNAPAGSPRARLIEARVRDQAPTGFLSLANIYASMLLIPLAAGAGFTAGALRQAVARARADTTKHQPGHVDNQVFATGLLFLIVLTSAAMLVFTGSRGAIGTAVVASGGGLLAWRLQSRILPRPRRWALLALAGMATGVGSLLVWGAVSKIPVKTLAFRWQYWIGATRVWLHNMWMGVGGGNFQAAYLHHRLLGAEEAVQLPHNILFGALGQFGLAGLVLVVVAAWLAVRPVRPAAELPAETSGPPVSPGVWAAAGVVVVAAALSRTVFFDWSGLGVVWLWEVGTVAGALAIAAGLAGFVSLRWSEDAWLRWGLRAGVAALLVHNLVSYSFWTPGAAGWFWLSAGLLVATGRREAPETSDPHHAGNGRLRWLLPAVIAVLLVFPAVDAVRSATLRAMKADAMVHAIVTAREDRAMRLAWDRMKLDQRDPLSAATASRLALMLADRRDQADLARKLSQALQAARLARQRDPRNFKRYQGEAMALWYHAYPDAFVLTRQSRTNPASIPSLQERAGGGESDLLAMHELGAFWYTRGKWDDAMGWWSKVASDRPGSTQARLNLAAAAWLADRREDATDTWQTTTPRQWPEGVLEALTAAQKMNPTDARLWLGHATRASEAGDVERTDAWTARALEINEATGAGSVYRLRRDERARIEMLRRQAEVLAENRPESPRSPVVIEP